jgi:hypothetical protein
MVSSTATVWPVRRPTSFWWGACDELLSEQLRGDRCRRNFVAQIALDLGQRHGELFASEADRIAFRAGTSCTAYAMNIIRSVLRQVEVEHMADIGNVQTT